MMWIPLRSAKMNRRILGFHRRVWCPKWTPAFRRSSRFGCAMRCRYLSGLSLPLPSALPSTGGAGTRGSSGSVSDDELALAELEPLPSLGPTRLLALDRPRIAREQAKVTQLPTIGLVDLHQGTRRREAQCTGLSRQPSTFNFRAHVVAAERVSRREWLLNSRHQRRTREIIAEGTAVHVPLAGTRREIQTADGFLA